MALRMLVDARHREETRVAVVKGNRIEEFDFESAEHKQLKGNIYLAKVTRVEPSLQAAFVDYGGNRHGFLAFSEIHPDYYQIPQQDREALLAEEAEHAAEEAALRAEVEDDEDDAGDGVEEMAHHNGEDEDDHAAERDGDDEDGAREGDGDTDGQGGSGRGRRRRQGKSEQAADELRNKRMALRRRYKIQDVIKRRQVLLVQVVKEERGNKGAALSTYLSLAGRYCVLMPNTSHGGGISRKINNNADRKRLKSIIADMDLPSTMGCIVRTAGLSRTKTEIRRDFDYLARLWDEIREKTLQAVAPALIHDDSDLIKRAIRDIYHREIEEVIIEGEEGYRAAKDFMKLLMPSHARRVKPYADPVSLFQRYGVEDQLAAMYHPVVQLKSGGYLVINPTEALVSIDINSGRSTREHNIEQTAVSTNLEAAREIARQLRLRDMAGLVVIDFIDMEHGSNVRKVEKAMKEALKDDRARIQVGRISGFGLMEMSRQRLRTGVLEASTRPCPHCEGTGLVRTASSAGLSALRLLEEEAARGRGSLITLRASQEAAFYVLNNKRREIDEIESRYGVRINILPDGEIEGARMSVEAAGPKPERAIDYTAFVETPEDFDLVDDEMDEDEEDGAEEQERESEAGHAAGPEGAGEQRDGTRKRRRRRRGRRNRGEPGSDADGERRSDAEGDSEPYEDDRPESADDVAEQVDADGESADTAPPEAGADDADGAARRTRRGRRGGRRRRGGADVAGTTEGDAAPADDLGAAEVETEAEVLVEAEAVSAPISVADAGEVVEPAVAVTEAEQPMEVTESTEVAEKPKTRRRPRARKADADLAVAPVAAETADAPVVTESAAAPAQDAVPDDATAEEKPVRKRRPRKAKPTEAAQAQAVSTDGSAAVTSDPSETWSPADVLATDDGAGSGPDSAPSESAPSDGDGPARRGWWQRTFGN